MTAFSKRIKTAAVIALCLIPLWALCSITLVKLNDRPRHDSWLNEEIKNTICAKVESLPGNHFAVVEVDRPYV